MLKITDKID